MFLWWALYNINFGFHFPTPVEAEIVNVGVKEENDKWRIFKTNILYKVVNMAELLNRPTRHSNKV